MKSIETKSLSVGMVKDVHPLQQPEGSYPFALNAILESRDGDHPFITNEEGNIVCASLASDSIIVGHVLTDTNSIILFLSLNDGASSSIVEYNPDTCTITTIVESADLNFSKLHPIKALFRIRKGCQRTVYFTDNNNPYRTINLDSLSQYYDGGTFNCESIKLTRDLTIPTIALQSVNDFGGSLKVGTHQFFIQYLDEDLNPTIWVNQTLPIPIVDENLSSSYFEIDGGIPVIDSSDAVGSVQTTTKSITLRVSNLDTSYPFYRLGIVESAATTGIASALYLTNELPITGEIDFFTYSNNLDLIQTTIDDLNVDPLEVDKVKAHTQIDNRLVIGNLSYNLLDYAAIQKETDLIEVTWVTKDIDKESIRKPNGSSKSPIYYVDNKSFLRDEVYALGIKGKKKNGYETPVFHIPGRISTLVDTVLLNVGVGSDIEPEDARHLEPHGGGIATWKIRNTADISGVMAYYETNTPYPNTLDCDGIRIFPLGNVRHHKFPDNEITNFHDDDHIKPLGIRVDLTNFLAALPTSITDEVIKWEIVVGKRDEVNRTIVDKGLSLNTFSGDDFSNNGNEVFAATDRIILGNLVGTGTQTADTAERIYFSPTTMLLRKSVQHSHINIEKEFSDSQVVLTPGYFQYSPDWNTSLDVNYNRVVQDHSYISRFTGWDGRALPIPVTDYYFPIKQALNGINFNNISFSVPIIGQLLQDGYNHLSTTGTIVIKGSYTSLKTNNEVHPTLDKITYLRLSNPVEISSSISEYYGGDIFLTYFGFKFMEMNAVRGGTYVESYFESETNAELRHEGLIDPTVQSYYKFNNETVLEYLQGTNRLNADGDAVIVSPDYLAYNKDYSKLPIERVYFPLSNSFDFCLDCTDDKPYRIVASEKSFQDEVSDNYRIFLANNFIDLNGDSGGITELINMNDNLYVFTPNYPIFVPTRPQSIQTNESVAYVGTGDIFSVPYKKLTSAPYKYSGCNDFKSIQSTEFGVFYVDSINGAVHLLTDNAREITQGMHNWFEENIPYNIDQQLETLGYPKFKFKEASNGIGITSTYDQRHRRYLFTKLDYKIIDEENFGGIASYGDITQTSSKLYLDNNKGIFWYLAPLNIYDKVDLNDETYFENKSFTLSYSPLHEKWVSYHSYMPNYYINDGNNFWSSINSNPNIWRHNYEGAYQRYYGVKHDHILDMIFNENPLQVKTFAALEFKCDSVLDNVSTNKFFDRVIFYNSYQSSGLKNILLKESTFDIFNTSSSVSVEKVQNGWRMNDIRNYADSDLPLWSTDWTDLLSNYYIDHVPNPVAIDLTTSEFELSRLRDAWFGVRVFSNHADNIKLNTNIVTTQQRISYR